MKTQNLVKKTGALILTICLMLSMMVGVIPADVQAAEGEHDLYYLNTEGWEIVGAYIYSDQGELLGGWGTTTATAAAELGDNWVKVTVPGTTPYNIIFFNKTEGADAEAERAEVYIDAADKIYVAGCKADGNAAAYTSQTAAEVAMGVAETVYPVYFLNTEGWASVGAYIYGNQGELLGGFWNTTAIAATELGEKWVKVNVSAAPPYNIIFYNRDADAQRAELYLDAADKIYVTADGQAHTSQLTAEVAMGVAETCSIYFLNTNGWESVGAHAYYENESGVVVKPMGEWGSAIGTAATELGENWVKLSATQTPPYSVIIYNAADDTQRFELYIDAADKIYVTADSQAYTSKAAAESAMGIEQPSYPIYFLNSDEWAEVGAYIYGDQGELLGGWGTTVATASELGGNWVEVSVPAEAPYNIIFFNTADPDNQRAELLIDAADKDYVTVNEVAYTTQAEAEESLTAVPPVTETYPIYFLNAYGWEGVGAHAYYENEDKTIVTPMGSWGSAIGTAATELGEKWVKFSATQEPPYTVIFYNTADDTQRVEYYIDAADKIYATVKNVAFASQAEAEAWNNSGVELLNMTLSDNLGVNFYLNVDSTLAPDTVANIKVAGVEYSSNSLAGMTVNDKGYYVLSVELAAAQMTEEVAVELWVGDRNLYYNTYTVRGYADYILTDVNNEFSDETKALVRQMLEYGTAAQVYFGHNTGNYANANLDPADQTAIPERAATEMSVSGKVEGITYYGASLVFESKIAVRFYFSVSGDINDYNFGEGNTPVLKDGLYYVEIADINPQAYDTAITLTVNDTLSVTYSPMNYIVRMSANGSANLKTLLLALYNYHLAACEL